MKLKVVIYLRNISETRIGKFKGDVDPCTTAFRNFSSWVESQFTLKEGSNEKHENVERDGLSEITGKENKA